MRTRLLAVFLLLAGICFTALSAAGKSVTTTLNFAGKPGTKPGVVTSDWLQNMSKNFAPYGKALLVNVPLGKIPTTLKVTSAGKQVDIYTSKAYKCTGASRFHFNVIFSGKGKLRLGLYEYDAKGKLVAYQAQESPENSKSWDQRQFFFNIRNPKTVQFRPFVSAKSGETFSFAEFSFTELPKTADYLLPSHNLKLWYEKTKGTNLARGKKVTFFPEPAYIYTKGGDSTDLTDGKFNNRRDQLWFERGAVAWFNAFNGASIIVDLGSVQPVEKAVIRICGGRLPPNNIKFPQYLQAYVSKDGKNYYQAASLIKLKESEYELSNWKTHYFLKESDTTSGTPYVYPFELFINANARYVVIHSPFSNNWVHMACDELAVIREKNPKKDGFDQAYQKSSPKDLFHKELQIRPRMDTFYVADNLDIPNFFIHIDQNPVKKGKISYSVDLPSAITYTNDSRSYPQPVRLYVKSAKKGTRTVHRFRTGYDYNKFISMIKAFKLGPFFFKAPKGYKIPKGEDYALFTTYIDGKKHSATKLPLKVITIPEVKQPAKLFNGSIGARTDYALGWPNAVQTLKKMGMGNVYILMPNSLRIKDTRKLYDQIKQAGLRVRHFTVPTLYIHGTYKKAEERKEYHCTTMTPDQYGFCPSYRGKYFKEILAKITESVRAFPPDYITFEDECWQPKEMNQALDCKRCEAYRKQKGMTPKRFIQWVQADFLSHYKQAVIDGLKGTGKKYAPSGHYVFNPFAPGYSCRLGPVPHLGGWDLFPKYTDELHMSYYGRSPQEMQEMMRKPFKTLKNTRALVPFITGGSGSYTEAAMYHIPEQIILEAAMNGASGFELYTYHSLESPLDYFYIARAMTQLLPYEKILMDGALTDVKASSRKLLYTGRRLGNEMLILAGNYGKFTGETTTIELPGKPLLVKDIFTGKTLKAVAKAGKYFLTVNVEKDSYKFLYIRF